MADKNIQLKNLDKTDLLYPITKIENVTNLQSTLDSKQNELTQGDNVTIDANNKISAVDTKYTVTIDV